jgi:hypothetical protein
MLGYLVTISKARAARTNLLAQFALIECDNGSAL